MSTPARLLFIGDSITDAHRRGDPEGLGDGYVRLIRDWLVSGTPDRPLTVVNSGISGHKITDLAVRWDADVLAHAPDLVSIKIGINDVWHGIDDPARGVPVDEFEETYRELLTQTLDTLPGVRLVLCDPTVISPPAALLGNETLAPYVALVETLARTFHATHVPLHRTFRHAEVSRPDLQWTTDGVHPTGLGHTLIARQWLAATGLT